MKRMIDTTKVNLVGPRIREARIAAGLTQKQLSERLELLPVYTHLPWRGSIPRIENGRRAVTDIEIAGIAKILNVSPNRLFGWEEEA